MHLKNFPDSGLDAVWFAIEDVVEGRRTPSRGDIGPLRIYLESLKSMENPPADDISRIEEIIKPLLK